MKYKCEICGHESDEFFGNPSLAFFDGNGKIMWRDYHWACPGDCTETLSEAAGTGATVFLDGVRDPDRPHQGRE